MRSGGGDLAGSGGAEDLQDVVRQQGRHRGAVLADTLQDLHQDLPPIMSDQAGPEMTKLALQGRSAGWPV